MCSGDLLGACNVLLADGYSSKDRILYYYNVISESNACIVGDLTVLGDEEYHALGGIVAFGSCYLNEGVLPGSKAQVRCGYEGGACE